MCVAVGEVVVKCDNLNAMQIIEAAEAVMNSDSGLVWFAVHGMLVVEVTCCIEKC